ELVAVHLEIELPAGQPTLRRRTVDSSIVPAVPNDHRTGAIVPGWDEPFEVGVLERVIFGLHREPAFFRIDRRPAGDSPADQDAGNLQTKVPVHTAGGMLLHDEPAGGRSRR